MKSTHTNKWTDNAEVLVPAFIAASNEQTSKLLTMGLKKHIPETLCRIIDIGGGEGRQAAHLAELGHTVCLVDIDPQMLLQAEEHFKTLDSNSRKRIIMIEGTVDDVRAHEPYDVVCCHSVLMYEHNWKKLVQQLSALLNDDGILSIMAVNPHSRAMRLGRQQRWREVIATISTGQPCDPNCIPSNDVSRQELELELRKLDVLPLAWYGVGVFEDGDTDESLAAEWLAGITEPYKSIARCYHLIAKK